MGEFPLATHNTLNNIECVHGSTKQIIACRCGKPLFTDGIMLSARVDWLILNLNKSRSDDQSYNPDGYQRRFVVLALRPKVYLELSCVLKLETTKMQDDVEPI